MSNQDAGQRAPAQASNRQADIETRAAVEPVLCAARVQATAPSQMDRRSGAVPQVIYRNAPQVRARYGGICEMTLWRWMHSTKLGFPKPVRINGRRLWTEESLAA